MTLYGRFGTPIAENVVPDINIVVLGHNITNFYDLNYNTTQW